MNELQKFTASLQGHWTDKEIKELVIQWKIDNQWEQNKPQPMGPQEAPKPEKLALEDTYIEEEVFEEVKTEGDAAGAGVEPVKAEAPIGPTDSTLEDGSLDIPNTETDSRYIQFKNNNIVYEDDYLKNYAGTEDYPSTFDEYAEKFKTTPITPSPSIELEETLVTYKNPFKPTKEELKIQSQINVDEIVENAILETKGKGGGSTSTAVVMENGKTTISVGEYRKYFCPDPDAACLYPDGTKVPSGGGSVTVPYKNILQSPGAALESRRVGELVDNLAAEPIASDEIIKKANTSYFNLDNLKGRNSYRTGQGVGGGSYGGAPEFTSDEEYDKYLKKTLGKEKYDDYLAYKKNEFTAPYEFTYDAKLDLINQNIQLGLKAEGETNSVLSPVYKYFSGAFKEAGEVKNKITGFEAEIQSYEQKLKTDIAKLDEEAGPTIDKLNKIQKQIVAIQAKAAGVLPNKDGDYASFIFKPKDVSFTNNQIKELKELQQKYQVGYNDYLKLNVIAKVEALSKTQASYETITDIRNNYISNLPEGLTDKAALIDKNLSLDYGNWKRITSSMYDTFVAGPVNFSNLVGQTALQGIKSLTLDPGLNVVVDAGISNMKKLNYEYNKELEFERSKLSTALNINDIGNKGITFVDYALQATSDQSGNILLSMLPYGAAGRTFKAAEGLAVGSKAYNQAKKVSIAAQRTRALYASRVVKGGFFAVEGGSKYTDLSMQKADAIKFLKDIALQKKWNKITPEELEALTEQIEDAERKSNLSFSTLAFNAYSTGGIAMVAESLGTLKIPGILRKSAKNYGLKNVIKTKIYKNDFQFAGWTTAKNIYRGLRPVVTKAAPIEVIEETVTAWGHNVLDVITLDEDKSLMEGINADFAVKTLFSTLAMTTPTTTGTIIAAVKSDFSSRDEIKNNIKLRDELTNLFASMESLEGNDLKIAKKRKKAIIKELALSSSATMQKMSRLTPEQIFEVAEINRQLRAIDKESFYIGKSGEAFSESNKNALSEMKNEAAALLEVKDKILNTKAREMALKAKNLNKQLGTSANIDLAQTLGLNDLATDVALTLMNPDGNYININDFVNVKEVEKTLREDYGYSDAEIKEVMPKLVGDKPVNALQFGDDIIVNQRAINLRMNNGTNAEANYAAIAPIEEIFHMNVNSKNLRKAKDKDGNYELDESAANAINDVVRIITEKKEQGLITEEDYDNLISRFNLYKDGKGKVYLKSGERGKAGVDIEEVMAQVNNAIILGKIKASDIKMMPSLKGFLNNTISSIMGDSSWLLELNSARDVINFMSNFQNRVQNRTLKINTTEEEDKTVKASKGSNVELLKQAEEAVQNAINEDPGNPDYFNNIEKAENALDAAAAKSENAENIKPIAKKKAESNKTIKVSELGPKDPVSKKIMDTYNEGMEGVNRPESTSKKPLPASLERKLIPMFDGYINTIVQQKFKQLEPEALQYQDAVSILRAEVVNAIRTFDPKVNKNLAGYVKKYGVQTRQSLMFKDANTEFTVGLENAASTISTKTKTNDSESFQAPNTVDVTTLGPAKNKKVALEKIIKIEKGERPNFKTLNNKYFNEVSEEIFGIDGKKVRGNVSLNYGNSKKTDYSEANALQNIFKNNEDVRSFIKTMPPYNVATSETIINKQGESINVSTDTKGRAIGINPKVLKTFYQKVNRSIPGISNPKGRSLGKTTQTDVFELKPEFRGNIDNDVITELQSSVGVNKGELSVPIKGPARTEFGSLLTGLSKMYVDNVINTIGRSKLDSSQAKADLGAGKSKSMASRGEAFSDEQTKALIKLSTLRDKNALGKALGFKTITINEETRAGLVADMLDAFKNPKYKLSLMILQAAKAESGGIQSFYGNITKGKFVPNKDGKQYIKTTDGKYILASRKKSSGITNWVPRTGKLFYGLTDPNYIAIAEVARKYEGPKFQKISIPRGKKQNEVLGEEWKKDQKQKEKNNKIVRRDFVNELAEAHKNGLSLDIIGSLVIQSYQATSGLIKVSASFDYASAVLGYGVGLKHGPLGGVNTYREEHNPPASVAGASIMWAIKYNKLDPERNIVELTNDALDANYYQTQLAKFDDQKLDQAKLEATLPEGFTIFDNPIVRFAAAGIDLNTIINISTGETIAETFNAGIPAVIYDAYNANEKLEASAYQNEQVIKAIKNPNYNPKKNIKVFQKLVPGKSTAAKLNSGLITDVIKYDKPITVQTAINALEKTDKALNNARRLDAPVKKIRVFDFDDTLAKSKSMVIVNLLDGSTTQINATQFAQQASDLESQGAEFDFSEFSKVVDGKKGPLFEVAKKIADVRGTEDVFILTARPQNADGPIQAFMKANGIDIPLKNITGLGDGTAQAKAGWIMGKAAEGYNDFYFADDAVKNVKAVKEVLSQVDVKSKVQLARASKGETFNIIVNDMIEDSSGIETYKQYSAARAKTVGANKGRFNFFIPASAEDFTGLLYKMLGKGKKGDAQMAFLKTNLLDPYDRAESAVTQAKIAAANDFKALKQNLKTLPKSLSKPTGIGGFTFSHAVRVAVWSKQGMDIPGLSKRDIEELNDFVNNNAELSVFTDELMKIQKGKPYPKPGKSWLGGNITSDIINDINKVNRAEYQQEWRENVDIIFSEDNMNKMEAAYGTRWRKAIEDSLRRMKSGSNRPPGGNSVTDGLLDWLNNSVGAVMFLNTRSALLQTISAVNFINWGDNNIVKAGVAFANQKQFWSDFMTLMNSDYLVERRNGLKINVSESEIADAVRDSDNKVKSAIAFLLSKGFVMTRFADSFAIASGGSTFYRNRVQALVGKGMEQKAAEAQAFEDFRQIAEESQQSSNPNRISQQQASGAGRVILAWANTPMQYARIQKRAGQDLINGRGDWKTNVSKIVYYGAVQNLIFNALQQAVFALGFGEDDEEEMDAKKSKKISRIANGMIDSQLKGLGIGGAAVVALKSTLMELGKQYSKDRPKYEEAVFDLLGFSPPLGSKVQKINGGLRSFSWNMKDIKSKGFSLDNPAYLAGAQITTGLTNIPLDRVIKKLNSMRGIVSEQSSLWQKVALGLGWSTWDVGLGYYGGFDAAKVLTPEEEKVKEIDDMKKLTKTQEQIDMLLDLGLTKKEIKALGKEQVRVEKIIELQNAEAKPKEEIKIKEEIKEETKPTPEVKAKPKNESVERRLRRQFDSIKDENKPDQVKTLLKFGLTKKQIRTLQYEKNRVNKILELMEKNK